MESLMGTCRYCGSQVGVMAENQSRADAMITESCNCTQAQNERKKEKLREKLEGLAGNNCTDAGFAPVEKTVFDAIEALGFAAIDGLLQTVTIKVDGTVITIKAGEKTKATRKFTYEQSEEIC